MLLNYDFLELVDEPHRNISLTSAIDKALADKKLARQNKPSVRVLGKSMPLSKFLDAVGDEISRLKYDMSHKTIKGSTIESSNLISIYKKIASGLPFGTISAFRPFKDAFYRDFTEKERNALIYAYKSGADPKDADIIAQYWLSKSVDLDPYNPIKVVDFFHPQPENEKETGKFKEYKDMIENIYTTIANKLGEFYVDKFLKKKATMRDFMSSPKFLKKYRYTYKDNMKRTRQLKSLLDSKRHFLGYIQVIGYWKDNPKDNILPDKETSFFVFQNEPSNTFDLSKELLLLARHFNQAAICYCDNAKTDKVELVSALPNEFGDVWAKFTDITFTIPLTQSITRLHNKVYTFFEKKNMENYGVSFEELSTTKLKAMRMPKDIEGFNIPCKAYIERHIKTSIHSSLGGERNYLGRTFDMNKVQQYELQAIKRLDLKDALKVKVLKQVITTTLRSINLSRLYDKAKKRVRHL
ncbi:hypothetical protein [Helicobacter acinonychis]|uniref:hypothetical protein n=1 Tax=Helicobacter acinonychis TaxID=212 RepID=UPI0039894DE3